MFLAICMALFLARFLPSPQIVSAVSTRFPSAYLRLSAPLLSAPHSGLLLQPSAAAAAAAAAAVHSRGPAVAIGSPQRQTQPKTAGKDFQPRPQMPTKKAREVKEEREAAEAEAGTDEEAQKEETPLKRKLKDSDAKPAEKKKQQPRPRRSKAKSSSGADAEAASESEETEETDAPVKETPAAKKRRGTSSKSTAATAASGGKKAAAAAEETLLKTDEEFAAHAALAAKSRKFVGAHISAAGGVHNALLHCFDIKGQAFALFLKSQRKWVSPPLAEEAVSGFKERCERLAIDKAMQVLPHGSYLINVANPDKAKQANAYNALLDDLQRCEKLGITLYNIHPGSTVGDCSKEEGIKNIAAAVNRAHKDTSFVVIVLENMAGQKNVVGSKFEDLRDIINLVDNKDRVGVCLDTCHLFAAGYDIRTAEKFEKVMEQFDSIVGYKYLKGMHLNDSKSELSSGLDRHELLGKGHLGLEPFKYIMRHPTRFKDMPLVLETPDPTEGSIWKKEVKQMYSFLEEKVEK